MLISQMTTAELLTHLAAEPERQAAIFQVWDQNERMRRDLQGQTAIRQHECELRVLHELGRIHDLLSLAARRPLHRHAAIIQALQIIEAFKAFMRRELQAGELITDTEFQYLIDAQCALDDLMGKYGSLIYHFEEDQSDWFYGCCHYRSDDGDNDSDFGDLSLIREMDPTYRLPYYL